MLHRLSLILPFAAAVAMAGCDVGDATKDVTAGVVSTTVEATKGVAGGVKEGIKEGRKGTRSLDGARVLSTADEVAEATTLTVFTARPAGDRFEVVLAVENTTDEPVHLVGLSEEGGALLVDAEGFSTRLAARDLKAMSKAIAVPPKAKVKAPLMFDPPDAAAATVRVWGQDLALPEVAPEAAPAE